MASYRVTVIPGDGTGPEIMQAAQRVLEATGIDFEWVVQEAGQAVLEREGVILPERVIESIKDTKICLKGPLTTPMLRGIRSANVTLRKSLDLYANIRPAHSYTGMRSRYSRVDLVIIRENTEDLYSGIEFQRGSPEMAELVQWLQERGYQNVSTDAAISMKYISFEASHRIAKFAFEYATANNRRKVTAVHKSNIMRFSDGLFLSTATDVAKEYPNIQFDDRIVDSMCMQLTQRPEQYDVLVLPNLYGDIISDLTAGIIGGLGVAPSANIGENYAVFEPVHGSAPRYTGQNKVNPMAMMFSGALMLRHLGEYQAATQIERAISDIIAEGKYVTYDLKPHQDDRTAVGTSQVADAVIERMRTVRAGK